ncbi:hypothetical protein IMSHALPRED_000210 [Imshaugia aleurites]|uniref:Aromatic prenyltransferase n=1 Tax=Imshaugia aleurites TaxID=172621 RepID=A0A8H3EE82_9LECA|nr:hypothetical protein IMSHALPRED_000210 [Imshaugia aleurites]
MEATVCHPNKMAMISSESLIASISGRATEVDYLSTSPMADSILVAWHRIDSKRQGTLNVHANYWWKSSGYAMAILLGNAGYSYAARIRILDFFSRCIAPNLGTANEPEVERWKSFMTDDHNPIELSWDWHTGYEPPTIRFSIEPVGEEAGTVKDPHNRLVADEFLKAVLQDLPATNLQWFYHFESYFGPGAKHHSPVGHQSHIFWAFDLDEKDITAKAYFFPEYRAHVTQKTNIQVISEAIEAAPSCTSEDLSALYTFQEFVREQAKLLLEMNMLAIDLVKPSQSRFKIYFRTRETSFGSVREVMTLGGRSTNSDMVTGLQSLRHLWDNLFDKQGVPDNSPLSASKHRTAGILYYVEFRLGSKALKVKIYIPVRHYAQNDWQIMSAVSDFMCPDGNTQSNARQTPLAFREAMCNML